MLLVYTLNKIDIHCALATGPLLISETFVLIRILLSLLSLMAGSEYFVKHYFHRLFLLRIDTIHSDYVLHSLNTAEDVGYELSIK